MFNAVNFAVFLVNSVGLICSHINLISLKTLELHVEFFKLTRQKIAPSLVVMVRSTHRLLLYYMVLPIYIARFIRAVKFSEGSCDIYQRQEVM